MSQDKDQKLLESEMLLKSNGSKHDLSEKYKNLDEIKTNSSK